MVADVIHAIGSGRACRVGLRFIPILISGGDYIKDAHHTFHNIIDIGKVAEHIALIENLDGAVVKDCVDEEEWRHIRASPRAIDCKETQACGGQVIEL